MRKRKRRLKKKVKLVLMLILISLIGVACISNKEELLEDDEQIIEDDEQIIVDKPSQASVLNELMTNYNNLIINFKDGLLSATNDTTSFTISEFEDNDNMAIITYESAKNKICTQNIIINSEIVGNNFTEYKAEFTNNDIVSYCYILRVDDLLTILVSTDATLFNDLKQLL